MFLLTISIQRLQPNSKAYAIRNVMYAKNNGYNLKLRIFSFIPQRRRVQPNFINDTYQTTNQTSTTQTTRTTTSTWVSPLTQNLCSYNWDSANFGVFMFKFQPISKNSYSTNFVHFMHHQFVHFINPENLYVYWWTISYILSIPTWIRYRLWLPLICARKVSNVHIGLLEHHANKIYSEHLQRRINASQVLYGECPCWFRKNLFCSAVLLIENREYCNNTFYCSFI